MMGLFFAFTVGTVSGQQPRKAIFNPTPTYPELARRMHLTGTVKVTLIVGTDGLVKDAQFQGGHPVLVEAVQKTVKDWKYAPATSESAIPMEFKF
jgi:TonB family protein